MPTYGLFPFGLVSSFVTRDLPRASGVDLTFGLDLTAGGVDGGGRGRRSDVAGILSGLGASGLAAALSLARGYQDGVSRDLVDDLGATWSEVQLETFTPLGRETLDADGVARVRYRAVFLHLR